MLLHIHGGPGYVSIPMSWWFSRDWEEYFTVVQWDQRAAGKTYLLTDPAVILPTLTRERFVADAEEMAAWVRTELRKDKIFVQGHSWGSFLGLELAKRHPAWYLVDGDGAGKAVIPSCRSTSACQDPPSSA